MHTSFFHGSVPPPRPSPAGGGGRLSTNRLALQRAALARRRGRETVLISSVAVLVESPSGVYPYETAKSRFFYWILNRVQDDGVGGFDSAGAFNRPVSL